MTKRKFLRPSREKIKKYNIFGFDIETYGEYNKFLMGSIVNENIKYVFWDKKEMKDFIFNSSKLKSSVIFATNLGFDFLGLFGDDINSLKKFRYVIRGSDFVNITLRHNNYNIDFRDTLNFARFSVKKLGNILGIPKINKPDFLGQKVTENSSKGKELELYNIRDSYISYKFAEFLQDSFNKMECNLKYTIASTSMGLFKRKYLKNWILQPEREDLIKHFKAYYGGRTESFYRGKINNMYLYDINSLYPYVMKKYQFPNPNYMKYTMNPNLNHILDYEGISLCKIISPNIDYPLLPFRAEDKLLFPIGKFTNWQSHIELRKAIELGYKIKPIETYYYTKTFNPFSEFVETLYKKRMEYKKLNNPMELPYKILLNSLYGKFSQKIQNMEIFFINNQKDKDFINRLIEHNFIMEEQGKEHRFKIETPDYSILLNKNGFYEDTSILYYITDLEDTSYPKFVNPILSLYVTSYARLELYKLMKKSKEPYYVDTDSVITDKILSCSNKLGDIKLEHEIKKGLLIKPKMYFIKTNDYELVKAKGLHGLNCYTDFSKVLRTKNYKFIKFSKFRESIRRNLKFNQKLEVVKKINLEDNKRLWKNKEINIKEKEKSKPIKIF